MTWKSFVVNIECDQFLVSSRVFGRAKNLKKRKEIVSAGIHPFPVKMESKYKRHLNFVIMASFNKQYRKPTFAFLNVLNYLNFFNGKCAETNAIWALSFSISMQGNTIKMADMFWLPPSLNVVLSKTKRRWGGRRGKYCLSQNFNAGQSFHSFRSVSTVFQDCVTFKFQSLYKFYEISIMPGVD